MQALDDSSQDDFEEGDDQTEDQPDVDHLHVRGGGQLLYLAGEDGGHHQHDGQVHSDGITEQTWVEEDGDVGDEEQEDGGEVGGQQLGGHLPLQLQGHVDQVASVVLPQDQLGHWEHGQVSIPKIQIGKSLWQACMVHDENLRHQVRYMVLNTWHNLTPWYGRLSNLVRCKSDGLHGQTLNSHLDLTLLKV